MPTKPIDSRKLKKAGSKGKRPEKKKTTPPPASSTSFGVYDANMIELKNHKKKAFHNLLSLSIVAYLGYNFFYACGSPFDKTSDKPAICEGIDPIKLDLYKAYESDFYKSNIDPYVKPIAVKVAGLYNEYGVPTQKKLVLMYDQHGRPLVNEGRIQASQVYVQHVEPTLSPLLQKSKLQADQARTQLQPYLEEASKQVFVVYNLAKDKWDQLPPPVKEKKNMIVKAVVDKYQEYENTELTPKLIELYWKIIDFYQYKVVPFIQTHLTTKHVAKFYQENLKAFVDQNVKPLLVSVKDRSHIDQLLSHALSLLLEKPLTNESKKSSVVASSIVESKTPATSTKAISDIPITTPTGTVAAKATTIDIAKSKVESSSKKASTAEPASASVTSNSATSTKTTVAATDATTATSATTATESIDTEATIGKDASNNDVDQTDDIIKPVSVHPTATPEYVEMNVEPPQADKKEAVFCPTCNSAEEQVIVAPTDKNLAPVPDEKEVFEVHNEPVIVPPQSPAKDTLTKEKEEDQHINAPIKQEPVVVLSESKKEEQLVPVKNEEQEEEQVFSTQVEEQMPIYTKNGNDNEKKNTDKLDEDLPEPAVPLKEQEEEQKEEAPVVTAVVDKQKVEIPLPIAKENEEEAEEKIAMPNGESEFIDTKEQVVIQEPVKDEPVVIEEDSIKAEPIVKEPIVPDDESKFEAEPQQQDQEEPVRYYRVEKALSQCPY